MVSEPNRFFFHRIGRFETFFRERDEFSKKFEENRGLAEKNHRMLKFRATYALRG